MSLNLILDQPSAPAILAILGTTVVTFVAICGGLSTNCFCRCRFESLGFNRTVLSLLGLRWCPCCRSRRSDLEICVAGPARPWNKDCYPRAGHNRHSRKHPRHRHSSPREASTPPAEAPGPSSRADRPSPLLASVPPEESKGPD